MGYMERLSHGQRSGLERLMTSQAGFLDVQGGNLKRMCKCRMRQYIRKEGKAVSIAFLLVFVWVDLI